MLRIKIFGLEDPNNSQKDIKSDKIEQLINDWLIDNQNIEIVAINVSSGGGYTSGEKYYILYKGGEAHE